MRRALRSMATSIAIVAAIMILALPGSSASAEGHRVIMFECEFSGLSIYAQFEPSVNTDQIHNFVEFCSDIGGTMHRVP